MVEDASFRGIREESDEEEEEEELNDSEDDDEEEAEQQMESNEVDKLEGEEMEANTENVMTTTHSRRAKEQGMMQSGQRR